MSKHSPIGTQASGILQFTVPSPPPDDHAEAVVLYLVQPRRARGGARRTSLVDKLDKSGRQGTHARGEGPRERRESRYRRSLSASSDPSSGPSASFRAVFFPEDFLTGFSGTTRAPRSSQAAWMKPTSSETARWSSSPLGCRSRISPVFLTAPPRLTPRDTASANKLP
jgi:hypothetical protein